MSFHGKFLCVILGVGVNSERVPRGLGLDTFVRGVMESAKSRRASTLPMVMDSLVESEQKETPDADTAQMVADMENAVRAKHAETQAHLDNLIQFADNKTTHAVDKKGHADAEDQTYIDNVGEEKTLRTEYEGLYTQQQNLHVQYNGAVSASNAAKDVEKTLAAQSFSCNALQNDCPSWKTATSTAIKNSADTFLQQDVKSEVDDYNSKAATANGLDGNLTSTIIAKEEKFNDWTAKRAHNINADTNRPVSRCAFGSALYDKCDIVGEYELLLKDVMGSHNIYSHSDRVSEWKSIQEVKCVLQEAGLANYPDLDCGTTFTEQTYIADVGTLELHAEQFLGLATVEHFTCDEVQFSFSGLDWQTPSAADSLDAFQVLSSDYAQVSDVSYPADHTSPWIFEACDTTLTDESDGAETSVCTEWCEEGTQSSIQSTVSSAEQWSSEQR